MLLFDYHQDSRQALLSWDKEDDGQRWLKILSGTCLDASEEAQRVGSQTISLPWWSFLGIRQEILNIISAFQLRSGHEFEILVHIGTLGSVFFIFYKDILDLLLTIKSKKSTLISLFPKEEVNTSI